MDPAIPGVDPRSAARGAWRARAAPAALALGYVACYLGLDWVSYIHPWQALGITPWNPPPALSIALLLCAGLRFAPALFPAALLAEIAIHDSAAPLALKLASSALLAAGYVLACWLMLRVLRVDPRLARRRDLVRFGATAVAAPLAIGVVYVGVHAAGGLVAWPAFGGALLQFWVGDVIGILATAPLLLLAVDAAARARLSGMLRRREVAIQAGVLLGALWLVFGLDYTDEFKYFYLLFLPVVWVAARHGLAGAAAAVLTVQLGVIVAIKYSGHAVITVLELQALMLALTVTALFLGVTVDERRRAAAELRRSLRLAAAGEMAGALAHELNQPLTAIANYSRAGRLLLEAGPSRREELARTVEHIVAESARAGGVVRRLRDFLRCGTTELSAVAPVELVQAALAAVRERAQAEGVTLASQLPPALPQVLADALEIEVVLRNLLANALDAVAANPPGRRTVGVRAEARAGELWVSVTDSGPGIAGQMRDRLFEPFATSKARGMGMGLAISRAIVEAHGGRIWAQPGTAGAFHFTLPLHEAATDHDRIR